MLAVSSLALYCSSGLLRLLIFGLLGLFFLFVSVPSFQSVADLGGQAGSDPDYRLVEW